jgi:hypothetical protein
MDTVRGAGLGEGACDPRTGDDVWWRDHIEGLLITGGDDPETVAEYNATMTDYHAEQGNWRPLIEQELRHSDYPQTAYALGLDPSYFDIARLFGGCPGRNSPRLNALSGLTFVYGHEVAQDAMCGELLALDPVGDSVADLAASLTRHLWSRDPTSDELEILEQHACKQSACDVDTRFRGLCRAILGAHELVFY